MRAYSSLVAWLCEHPNASGMLVKPQPSDMVLADLQNTGRRLRS